MVTKPKAGLGYDGNGTKTIFNTTTDELGKFVIDGFYTQEFSEYMNPIPPPDSDGITDAEYNALGGYTPISSDHSFRTRFAPSKIGLWKAQLFIEAGVSQFESAPFNFNVVESGNKGYMHASINGRYLELGDKTFIPVGCNAPWPKTDIAFDPTFAEATKYYNSQTNQAEYIYEGYRTGAKMVPRVYDVYKNVLQQMINGGANSFRMIMVPFATDVEFGKLGNYTDHLTQAKELDEILSFAEQRDVYLQWNTDIQFKYMLTGQSNYNYAHSWDAAGYSGPNNCYKDIPGINTPLDFFSNLDAKKYYKQRFRYILARWGYSTNISIIELLSEENQVGNNFSNTADHSEGLLEAYNANVQIFEDWNIEMGAYIKSFHNGKAHLLTCSYAGLPNENDETYTNENFDVIGLNCYDDGNISFGSYPIELLSKSLLNRQASNDAPNGGAGRKKTFEYTGLKTKPIVLAETGFSTSFVPYKSNCGISVVEYKRQMWQMPFSGLAGAYTWDVWYMPQMYTEFNNLKQFLNQFDFGDENELWIPGASVSDNYTNGGDYYSFVADAYEHMEDEERYRADMVYMVKKDRTRAVGVITNKTYNLYTSSSNTDCNNLSLDSVETGTNFILNRYINPYDNINNPNSKEDEINVQTNNLENGLTSKTLALWNMNNADYLFLFRNYTGSLNSFDTDIFSASNSNNKVNINVTINGNEDQFIRSFEATQIINSGLAQNPAGLAKKEINQMPNYIGILGNDINNKFSVSPNPSTGSYNIVSTNEIKMIEITSLSGIQVLLMNEINSKNCLLNLSNYANGSYIMNIQFLDGTFKQNNLVKL